MLRKFWCENFNYETDKPLVNHLRENSINVIAKEQVDFGTKIQILNKFLNIEIFIGFWTILTYLHHCAKRTQALQRNSISINFQ